MPERHEGIGSEASSITSEIERSAAEIIAEFAGKEHCVVELYALWSAQRVLSFESLPPEIVAAACSNWTDDQDELFRRYRGATAPRAVNDKLLCQQGVEIAYFSYTVPVEFSSKVPDPSKPVEGDPFTFQEKFLRSESLSNKATANIFAVTTLKACSYDTFARVNKKPLQLERQLHCYLWYERATRPDANLDEIINSCGIVCQPYEASLCSGVIAEHEKNFPCIKAMKAAGKFHIIPSLDISVHVDSRRQREAELFANWKREQERKRELLMTEEQSEKTKKAAAERRTAEVVARRNEMEEKLVALQLEKALSLS